MEFVLLRKLLPTALEGVAAELLAQKTLATEKTMVARSVALTAFLAAEYAAGQAAREVLPVAQSEELVAYLSFNRNGYRVYCRAFREH